MCESISRSTEDKEAPKQLQMIIVLFLVHYQCDPPALWTDSLLFTAKNINSFCGKQRGSKNIPRSLAKATDNHNTILH